MMQIKFCSVVLLVTLLFERSASSQDSVVELEERAIQAAVAAVAPSVVKIETIGGLEKIGQVLLGTGPTTGLIVSEDGYVISSAFNFVQQPSSILVTLANGTRASAQIVSRDHSRMTVLLKISGQEKLPVPAAVPRSEMIVGQWTLALGRTFDQPEPNLSVGILSATNRIWGKAIQTDAKISPSNYGGPLIDIRGRVLGVLVPLSVQAQNEVAGAELYDSGIGFAVPLAEINERLVRMKKGEDLHPGLLGVSFKGSDPMSDEALIAACPPKSPSSVAGLKVGDKIVDVDGIPVGSVSQLKHALGRKYAGEKVKVVALRSGDRLSKEIELAEKLFPYQHPFLGALPKRDSSADGVVVRFVYPKSGADKAGLKSDDQITAIAGKAVKSLADLYEHLAAFEPGAKLRVTINRAGKPQDLEIEATALPKEIPANISAARTPTSKPADAKEAVGTIQIKLPEETHECFAYVPENYNPSVRYGIVTSLHAPNSFDQEKTIAAWKPLCDRFDLILVVPKSADATKWLPTETPFIRKAVEDVVKRYNVDRQRIVLHGYQAGGSMAYLTGFGNRDLFRGVAAVDAGLLVRGSIPDNEPLERFSIYSAVAKDSKLAKAIQAALAKLEELKYPVVTKTLPEVRNLNADELAEVVQWIDCLDRF